MCVSTHARVLVPYGMAGVGARSNGPEMSAYHRAPVSGFGAVAGRPWTRYVAAPIRNPPAVRSSAASTPSAPECSTYSPFVDTRTPREICLRGPADAAAPISVPQQQPDRDLSPRTLRKGEIRERVDGRETLPDAPFRFGAVLDPRRCRGRSGCGAAGPPSGGSSSPSGMMCGSPVMRRPRQDPLRRACLE